VTNFLYPRTIKVTRPQPISGVGYIGYSGVTEADEATIISGLSANIGIASSGRIRSDSGLPSDSASQKYTIALPPQTFSNLPLIMERDMIYDDLGRRFQVDAYQPTPLGARIDVVRKLA
jgi:hypothetical protein